MGSMDNGGDDEFGRAARQLREAGVELVGEVPDSELGNLEAPEMPGLGADDEAGADELYRQDDGDYLAAAREAGGDLQQAGAEYGGGVDEADLGNLTPPETPRPEQPEQ